MAVTAYFTLPSASSCLASGLKPMTMPTLPSLKSWKAPSVRLVLPGLTWVTLCLLARSARNESVCTLRSLLIAHASPDFQSPPLFHIQIDHSACASSGPSGSAYPTVPLPRALLFCAALARPSHVIG